MILLRCFPTHKECEHFRLCVEFRIHFPFHAIGHGGKWKHNSPPVALFSGSLHKLCSDVSQACQPNAKQLPEFNGEEISTFPGFKRIQARMQDPMDAK